LQKKSGADERRYRPNIDAAAEAEQGSRGRCYGAADSVWLRSKSTYRNIFFTPTRRSLL
jgi:hypothetical protein